MQTACSICRNRPLRIGTPDRSIHSWTQRGMTGRTALLLAVVEPAKSHAFEPTEDARQSHRLRAVKSTSIRHVRERPTIPECSTGWARGVPPNAGSRTHIYERQHVRMMPALCGCR